MNKEEREQLRLLKQYTQTKLRGLEKTLNMLIKFARDDLKRIDKLFANQGESELRREQ